MVKRVLHIINGMGTGGAEKNIMNWYRNIDTSKIQFDFLVRSNQDFYKEEIQSLGGKYFKVSPFPKKILKNISQTYLILKKEGYECIHVHGNALIYIFPLLIARLLNYKKIIFHCHSTRANGFIASMIHKINKKFVNRLVTHQLACSKEALHFCFGNIDNGIIINNAMDLKRFQKRDVDYLYNELNLDKEYAIFGHIGRFLPVKNQKFIVDVFEKILIKRKKSYLLLIGSGPQKSEIIEYVNEKNLSDYILFLGERSDIEALLQIIDVIIFPSIYEGIPLVVLESQASLTKVIYSDSINPEVGLTPYAISESLKSGPSDWAELVLNFMEKDIKCNIEKIFNDNGYTIDSIVEKLYLIYEV